MTDCGQQQTMRSFSQTDEHALTERRHTVHCASRVEVNPGDQFGSWTVVKEAPMRPGWRRYVLVKCAKCAREKEVLLESIRYGKSKACRECYHERENLPQWLWNRFSQAKQRCERASHPCWNDYGGRGIEFRFESVAAAARWALENASPKKELLLDRIDNDGHYEPGNIRFVTDEESMGNRREYRPYGSRLSPDFVYIEKDWPYRESWVRTLIRRGWTRDQILAEALKPAKHRTAVVQTRIDWWVELQKTGASG